MKPISRTGSGPPVDRRVIHVAKGDRQSQKGIVLHKLSAEFLRRERHRYLVHETLFFVAIVALSSWPLVSLVEAMAHAFP